MAVAEMRMSSILPTIKCSNCGDEIQISMMGEHVCSSTSPKQHNEISQRTLSPQHAQHPFARPTRSAGPQSQRSASEQPPRTNRAPPPRIDPSAANRPYVKNDLLSPTGNKESPLSPISDNGRQRRPSATRSATTPNPRSVFARPPSPLLSSNLDCAFPPFLSPAFPPSHPGSPKSNVSSPKAPSVFSESDGFRRPRQGSLSNAASRSESRGPPPQEPSLQDLRNQEAQRDALFAAQNQPTQERSFPQRTQSKEDHKGNNPRSAPSSQNTSPNLQPGPLDMSRTRPPPGRPTRPGDVDGFLVQMKDEASKDNGPAPNMIRPDMRSHTFPTKQMPQAQQEPGVQRRPSEPVHQFSRPFRAPERSATPNGVNARPPPPTRSETMPYQSSATRSPPPRNPSRNAQRPEVRTQGFPQTGSASQHEHASHTPSDSGSSSVSGLSAASASPPLSAASSMSAFSASGDKTPQATASVQENKQWMPPQRPYAPLVRAATEGAPNFSTPRTAKVSSPPESPMDPMMQQPSFATNAGRTPSASRTTVQDTQQNYFARTEQTPPVPSQPQPQTQAQAPTTTPIDPIPRPSTATGKRTHSCRGCTKPIIGKSVKAADGRLTGRYHKTCFVCKTCSSPFTTGSFYVFDNDPYCEHHYHQLNNSLCTGCGSGIEGPYLETQTLQKFHSGCLTCGTCREVLSEDYFEVSGAVYCERHAFAAVRSAGGLGPKRNMERRTTRLMMM